MKLPLVRDWKMQVFLVKFKVVPDDIKRRRAKTNVPILEFFIFKYQTIMWLLNYHRELQFQQSWQMLEVGSHIDLKFQENYLRLF